ncbi:hypothetical protein AXF42_Ash021437 [Apostasia shenzhenica]|uniref:Uncharacterized protein n=1 Tax=Apostasia shenzhenica TaxID=1088818 RepID=A0A2H9ZX46_9ASPA|nr:hypothetical protein AXF42_Ash021437 [Apostasia shenzhenica]
MIRVDHCALKHTILVKENRKFGGIEGPMVKEMSFLFYQHAKGYTCREIVIALLRPFHLLVVAKAFKQREVFVTSLAVRASYASHLPTSRWALLIIFKDGHIKDVTDPVEVGFDTFGRELALIPWAGN